MSITSIQERGGHVMVELNIVFIVVIPVMIALLSAFSSVPSRQDFGNDLDFKQDRYKWFADFGLNLKLAGLMTVIAAVLDQGLYANLLGFAIIVVYALAMVFGFVRFREYKYRSFANQSVPHPLTNLPFVIGLVLFLIAESVTTLVYVL